VRTLCHDLAQSIPNIVRINRGKLNLDGIAEKALEFNADRVIIVDRWKGGPGKIKLFQAGPEGLVLVPPLIFVRGIRLQRELKGVRTKPVRSLTITTSHEKSPQVAKIAESLSRFLNVPASTTDAAASRYEAAMHVSSRASAQIQITFMLLPQAMEIGPRITVSHVVWEVQK
jgi:rRNA maturation protein Rpf1